MATEKLYHTEPYLREFTAAVLETSPLADGRWAIVLDRTAFYPEGGGQPADSGWLDDIPVLDVYEEDGQVIHIAAACPAGAAARGRIDWDRRFDHMQQHSGEHILSAVFADLHAAENVGFHLGADAVYIDVTMDSLTPAQAAALEDAANAVVFANRPVSGRLVPASDLAAFPLRKQPSKDFAAIRLVTVEGVDCCPCGGTHVAVTGEIGLIKIRSWERKGGLTRVDFVCGGRALADYRLCAAAARSVAARLSAPVADAPAAVERQLAKLDAVTRELGTARQELNQHLADTLCRQAETEGGAKLVATAVDGLTPAELADLARKVLAYGPAIVLLATASAAENKSHLLFACTPGLPADMGSLLKKALPLVGGKGGGSAHWAQGGGAHSDKLEDALRAARQSVFG